VKSAIVFITVIFFNSAFAMMPPKPGLYDSETGLSLTTGDSLPLFPDGFGAPLGGAKSTLDVVGVGVMAVVLIDFPDRPADTTMHPNSEYDHIIFSTGTYPTGSMNDFFIENSYDLFSLDGDVIGWTRTSYPYSHYDDNNYGLSYGGGMVAGDAAQLTDDVVDYSLYDSDGPDGVPNSGDDDGYVDAFTVIHSGLGAEETGSVHDIWSHAGYISYTTNDPRLGGGFIQIDRYTIQPEERLNADGDTLITGISVICHEYGHVLGLPDLYDGSRYTWGIGYWGLMGYGAWGAGGNTPESPAHLCAWSKMELGWVDPVNVTGNLSNIDFPPIENEPVVYKIWRDGNPQNQYFLLENRQQIGFDTPAPGHGLLIWHINYDNYPWHNRVELEQADGLNELDQGNGQRPDPHYYHQLLGDDGDPFPGTTNNSRFGPDTNPSSNDDNGVPTGVYVDSIEESGDTVYAHLIINFDFPPPVNLNDDYVCNGIELRWSDPGGASPDGYNIYRKIGINGEWLIRNSQLIIDTTFIDNEIILDNDFRYCVKADYGGIESDPVPTATYHLPDPSTVDYLLVGNDSTEWLNGWYESILDSLGLEGEKVDHILPYCGDYLADLPLLWLVSYPPRPDPIYELCHRDIALMDYLDRGGNVYIDDLYLTFIDTLIFNYLFYDLSTCIPQPFMSVFGVTGSFAEGLSFSLEDSMWSSNISSMTVPPEGGPVLDESTPCGCVDIYVDRLGYRAVVNSQPIHEFIDGPNGTRLEYFDRVIDFFGIRSSIEDMENNALPDKSIVLKAYPNPFNAEVRLQLLSGIEGDYELDIFDITGRKIRSYKFSGHAGNVCWDSKNEYGHPVSSGVYFARITGPNQKSSTIKLTLLR
jgi:immune inhibitor A